MRAEETLGILEVSGPGGPNSYHGEIPMTRENPLFSGGPDGAPDLETVSISSLLPADSPRSGGEDAAHILRLAESDAVMPPILVNRRTMRVIDGMHRVRVAALNGSHEVVVEYFDGTDDDAFLRAVELNVSH